MIKAILMFRQNRSRILDLGSVYDLWVGQAPLLQKQFDEVLRAQLVLTVSAFDTFIHDCVRIGLVNCFNTNGTMSNSLKVYPIPFEDLQIINSLPLVSEKAMFLNSVIKKVNSKDSYQSPTSVEYALGLLGVNSVWSKVSPYMRIPASDIKTELAVIVNRRNKIAHESDLDATGTTLNPITKTEVMHVLDFMYSLSLGIYKLVK